MPYPLAVACLLVLWWAGIRVSVQNDECGESHFWIPNSCLLIIKGYKVPNSAL